KDYQYHEPAAFQWSAAGEATPWEGPTFIMLSNFAGNAVLGTRAQPGKPAPAEQLVRWREAAGQDLVLETSNYVRARLSEDGEVALGVEANADLTQILKIFRWTKQSGETELDVPKECSEIQSLSPQGKLAAFSCPGTLGPSPLLLVGNEAKSFA